jgi:hypothetical protein
MPKFVKDRDTGLSAAVRFSSLDHHRTEGDLDGKHRAAR